ncbi:MAG TPA: ribosome maturation factor RimM [Polyangiaceae bacterium]|nr:ribosome maturation factor RimM [Polyangiaceae bacterium]
MSRAGEPSVDSPALEVGRVSKAHGITGELRVVPHWESSDALDQVEQIWLTQGGKRTAYAVERARAVPKGYLVKLRGVDDRNAAEALQGALVSVARSALSPLEPGEYYLVDLIGAKVFGPDGEIGEVTDIASHPTVDVIVVRLADGTSAEQPLSEPWLSSVDIAARQVILSSLDGLM